MSSTSNPTSSQQSPSHHNTTMITLQQHHLMLQPLTDPSLSPPTHKPTHFLPPTHTQTPPLSPPPSPPPSLDPTTIKQLTRLINFKGIKVPNDAWKSWVETFLPSHETLWKKAGIFDAIRASTYIIKRDDEIIIKMAHYWSPETNTFIFPWGECSITLEDVKILGGFSLLGQSVVGLCEKGGNFDEINEKLVACCLEIKRKNNYHVPFYEWIKYFKGKGVVDESELELEHVGLLVQWLSRYVFCVDQFDIDVNSFGFAINLANGCRLALGPAVLGSIYRDLTLLKRKIEGVVSGVDDGKSKLVLWSPMQLVQLWAWERFPRLSPKAKGLSPGELRVGRWHNVHKLKSDELKVGLEVGVGKFIWRPYVGSLENWVFPKFYSDVGACVVIGEGVDEELLSFARCLRPSELVGFDCVEQYLPHRVGLQFGMDQDIPGFVPRSNGDFKLAWSSYDTPLDGLELYLPPRLYEGDVTFEYAKLWKRVSGSEDVESAVPEKKRKRKRESKKMIVKKPPTSGEAMLCFSQPCDVVTVCSQGYGGDQGVSTDNSAPFYSTVVEPGASGNATLSLGAVNPVNHAENMRPSEHDAMEVKVMNGDHMFRDDGGNCHHNHAKMPVKRAPNTKEPPEGSHTEGLCSVLAEDDIMRYRAPFDSLRMDY